MSHVDFFSRNPVDLGHRKIDKIGEKEINLAEIWEDWLLAEQRRDPQIIETTRKLPNVELAEDIANTHELRSGILYRKVQRRGRTLCLPIAREALDGPLSTMCISRLCTWVGTRRSRSCTSITGSKEWRSTFANS